MTQNTYCCRLNCALHISNMFVEAIILNFVSITKYSQILLSLFQAISKIVYKKVTIHVLNDFSFNGKQL